MVAVRQFKRLWAVALAIALAAAPAARAQDRDFALSAPQGLADSGLLDYALPRFTLKTQTRVRVVGPGDPAEAALRPGPPGLPVFRGPQALWHLSLQQPDHPGARRFADWLRSDIGRRTVAMYRRDGATPFSAPARVRQAATPEHSGDAARGAEVSRAHCARCHVVEADGWMNAIGSTPSFFVLRGLADWDARFQAFYALNPHPAFTQVAEVTEPFAAHLPSPIVPMEITVADLEAIIAYVAGLAPADLGAPLHLQ